MPIYPHVIKDLLLVPGRSPWRIICVLLACLGLQACAGLFILPASNLVAQTRVADDHEAHDHAFRQRYAYIEHRVPRGEYSLHAIEFGRAFRGTRPSLVLMHGFPDSLHLYDLISPLLGQHAHVIAFDFLGWGHSDKPEFHEYDMASLRDDLEAVIDYFELSRVIPVVHDVSGPPGIDWVLDNPGRTSGMVLLNTLYAYMDEAKTPEAIELFSTPSVRGSLTRFGAYLSDVGWTIGFTNQVEKFFTDPQRREVYMPVFMHQAYAIRQAFFHLNDHFQAGIHARVKRLPELRGHVSPVYIIFGEDDPYLNPAVARRFHALFPNATLRLVPDANHYVQLDKPEVVARYILELLDSVSQHAAQD